MAAPIKTGMPHDLDLPAGYLIRFTANDPTTGTIVAGVKVSAVSILTEGGEAISLGDIATQPVVLLPQG